MDENKPEVRSDIDQIYSAVMADTEALEDAKMTLEVIKKTDPGVYDEMIDDTLSLIRKALSSSILGAIDRLVDPDQKPVAWGIANTRPTEKHPLMMVMTYKPEPSSLVVPLYTAPPQREWVGLTLRDVGTVFDRDLDEVDLDIARAIEAKLREKNG